MSVTSTAQLPAGPPPCPWKPGQLTVRRNGYGHYSLLDGERAVVTIHGSHDFAVQVAAAMAADYARCRAAADREADRGAELLALPDAVLGAEA